jgi:DNA-binding transcriptional MerR regulator
MFKIGDFSRLSQVSVKALRYYDERGLLKPARVDPTSNYRYYTADQLPRLHRLLVLKELGFSLDEIARALDEQLGVAELHLSLTSLFGVGGAYLLLGERLSVLQWLGAFLIIGAMGLLAQLQLRTDAIAQAKQPAVPT